MLTCDFEPAICKEENAKYTGKLTLKPLAYEDRLEIVEEQGMSLAEAGSDEEKKAMALLRFARKFSKERLPEFFVSSTLKRKEDGFLFDTLEKIKMDGEVASAVIPEITSAIISGSLSLGK